MVAFMKPIVLPVFAAITCIALPAYAGANCEVKSGPATAALVELYTSEGCSSCPPADKQLSLLRQQAGVQQAGARAVIVPLALHVSYWDAIGWKDPYAQKAFDLRQSELLANRKNRIVYTPQFFVNGNELRTWRNDLPATIQNINARPAALGIQLKTALSNDDLSVTVDVQNLLAGAEPKPTGKLYVALSESALVSKVLRGENSGTTLRHDDVVRVLFAPVALQQGSAHLQQSIRLPMEWQRQNLQLVAFVQDARDGNVLQALSTAQCVQSRGQS